MLTPVRLPPKASGRPCAGWPAFGLFTSVRLSVLNGNFSRSALKMQRFSNKHGGRHRLRTAANRALSLSGGAGKAGSSTPLSSSKLKRRASRRYPPREVLKTAASMNRPPLHMRERAFPSRLGSQAALQPRGSSTTSAILVRHISICSEISATSFSVMSALFSCSRLAYRLAFTSPLMRSARERR